MPAKPPPSLKEAVDLCTVLVCLEAVQKRGNHVCQTENGIVGEEKVLTQWEDPCDPPPHLSPLLLCIVTACVICKQNQTTIMQFKSPKAVCVRVCACMHECPNPYTQSLFRNALLSTY